MKLSLYSVVCWYLVQHSIQVTFSNGYLSVCPVVECEEEEDQPRHACTLLSYFILQLFHLISNPIHLCVSDCICRPKLVPTYRLRLDIKLNFLNCHFNIWFILKIHKQCTHIGFEFHLSFQPARVSVDWIYFSYWLNLIWILSQLFNSFFLLADDYTGILLHFLKNEMGSLMGVWKALRAHKCTF